VPAQLGDKAFTDGVLHACEPGHEGIDALGSIHVVGQGLYPGRRHRLGRQAMARG